MAYWMQDENMMIHTKNVDAIERGDGGTWVYANGLKFFLKIPYEQAQEDVEAGTCE